jgi:GBP family porin
MDNKKASPLVLALFAAAPAFAQHQGASTVQIYGRIDLSVNAVRVDPTARASGSSSTYVSSDTSFFGFRGSEDLGGGLRAFFKMESGFNADAGTTSSATTFWSRESLVGIGHAKWGALSAGYQYSPAQWLTTKVDPFRRSGTGSVVNLFQQSSGTGPRGFMATTANTLVYTSPAGAGFFGRALLGVDEGAAPYSRPVAFSLEHSGDRHFVGVSYDRTKAAGAAIGQPARVNATSSTYTIGATYDFTQVKLHGYYISNRIEGSDGMTGTMLGITVPLGESEITASMQRRNRSDAANSDASLLAVRYTHFLSKRSLIYVGAGRHTNHGSAAFGLNPARMDFVAGTVSRGATVRGYQIGMRHLF